jgi:glycerate kinase
MPAKQVAEFLSIGIRHVLPKAEIKLLPLADGGEGTVNALVEATGGHFEKVKVFDPLLRPIDSFYGILGDGQTAVIEMAAASGLELLKPDERNPLITSTYGTGELIKHAIDKGCKKIIIGLGGSATNDGGMGAAVALGVKFYDETGKEIEQGGGFLGNLYKIDTSAINKRLNSCKLILACDVTSMLTGPEGASYLFGPQKGANAIQVKQLDLNLQHYASVIKKQLGKDVEFIKGSGAAGGLAAGLMAFTNAEIRQGFDEVKEIVELEKWIDWADWIITGEGKIDSQTQYGKTPTGVANTAVKLNKPVIAVAGALDKGYETLYHLGITSIFSIIDKPMPLSEALSNTGKLLEKTAERIFRLIKLRY